MHLVWIVPRKVYPSFKLDGEDKDRANGEADDEYTFADNQLLSFIVQIFAVVLLLDDANQEDQEEDAEECRQGEESAGKGIVECCRDWAFGILLFVDSADSKDDIRDQQASHNAEQDTAVYLTLPYRH